MSHNFKILDADGKTLKEINEEATQVVGVSVRTTKGEAAYIRVQDDEVIYLHFDVEGKFNPTLNEQERVRRESVREFRKDNSPEPPVNDEDEETELVGSSSGNGGNTPPMSFGGNQS